MKKEETFDYYLRSIWLKVARIYNIKAAAFGQSMSVGFVLLSIDRDGTPSTSLGPKLGMEPTSLSRILKNLENDGLIIRKPDDQDKRVTNVILTEKGIEKRKIAKEVVLNLNHRVADSFSERDIKSYKRIMQKLSDVIDKELMETKNMAGNAVEK